MDPEKELKIYKTALRRQIQKTRLFKALLKQERGERLSPDEQIYIARHNGAEGDDPRFDMYGYPIPEPYKLPPTLPLLEDNK